VQKYAVDNFYFPATVALEIFSEDFFYWTRFAVWKGSHSQTMHFDWQKSEVLSRCKTG